MNTVTEPRFSVGTQFLSSGRHPRLCTVIDVLRTYSSTDTLVKVRYVAYHPGPLGQLVMDYDVCDTTIAKGKLALEVDDAQREKQNESIPNEWRDA
jgi:hypothetical protein